MEKINKTVEKTAIKVNTIRIEVKDRSLSSSEFTKLFKENKVCYSAQLAPFLIKRNVLIKTDAGFTFTDPNKPVHINLINDFITQSQEAQKIYNQKYLNKEKSIEITTKDGFKLKGIEHTNLRVVTISGQYVIVDKKNNIVKVL